MKQVNDSNYGSATTGNAIERLNINSLVNQLGEKEDSIRENARLSLVALGKPAIAPLTKALTSHSEMKRWEAAKALGQIADPASAPSLIMALEDDNFDVRWLAAEGLIRMGHEVTLPLLEALIKNSRSSLLREGAHHVLNHIAGGDSKIPHHSAHRESHFDFGEILNPVVAALEDRAPLVQVPTVARAAYDKLQNQNTKYGQA